MEMDNLFKDIMKLIEQNSMNQATYNTWFSKLSFDRIDFENNVFYLTVPTQFISTYLNKTPKHFNLIKKSIREVTGVDFDVRISNKEKEDYSVVMEKTEPMEAEIFRAPSRLNPKYTFNSFIVGKSNEFARAVSLQVAENYDNPSLVQANPLFIYGGVGLGKTHLMQAIGHFTLEQDPSLNVLYVTSEQFTNELINSIQRGTNENFRKKYRSVDLLLIDDIQFIADKDSTQEEFFNTFNELHSRNKQIVLTSDKPPTEIKNLEERLISRFAWGVIVDIGPPDLETRIAILRNKADSEGFEVTDEVINLIAENVRSNIRALEGALSSIIAYSKLVNGDITEDVAKVVLKDILSPKKEKVIDANLIKQVVAKEYGISVSDLNSKKRTANIAFPRQVAMYITRNLTELSLPKIGDEFGGRDHSTVIHAIDKVANDMEKNTELKVKITQMISKIKS